MKENKEVKQSTKKTTGSKVFNLGDEVKSCGKDCKIVEVLEDGEYHVKNLAEPHDSFIATVEEIE
jgi:dsDNA-specific endonuclease/ATPase MutS2